MKRILKDNSRRAIWASGALVLFLLLITNAQAIKANVLENLHLCIHTLVPSVFPMLVISAFLTTMGLPRPLHLLWHMLVGRLFAFSPNGSAVFFFGLTSGYPVGVKNAAALYRLGAIQKEEAQRLALSCVHPGIPFSVLAVGRAMFCSQATGWLLFFSVLLSDLLIARVSRIRINAPSPSAPRSVKSTKNAPQEALILAVDSGIRNMVEIIAWVVLFGVVKTAVTSTLPQINGILLPATEVTSAVYAAAKTHSPVTAAFSLGFGGLCVHLQLLKELNTIGVRPARFIFFRLIAGAMSAAFTYTGVLLFPQILPAVSQNAAAVQVFYTDLTGFLALCAVAILFILETYERKPAKYRNREN